MATIKPQIHKLVCQYNSLGAGKKGHVTRYISSKIEKALNESKADISEVDPQKIKKSIMLELKTTNFTATHFTTRLANAIQGYLPKSTKGPTGKVTNYFEEGKKIVQNQDVADIDEKPVRLNSEVLRIAYKKKAHELYNAGVYGQAYWLYNKALDLKSDDKVSQARIKEILKMGIKISRIDETEAMSNMDASNME